MYHQIVNNSITLINCLIYFFIHSNVDVLNWLGIITFDKKNHLLDVISVTEFSSIIIVRNAVR